MKIIFFDKNKEVCEAVKNSKILKDFKVKNCDLQEIEADALSTCSNPYYNFTGGIDTVIAKEFNLKQGGEWLEVSKGNDKIKNIILNETVRSDLSTNHKLVRKAYVNFFNLAKNNNWDSIAFCGFGIGVGNLKIDDMVKALEDAYRMYLTLINKDNVKLIDINNITVNNITNLQMEYCHYAQMESCYYAQMEYCYSAQMKSCYSAQMKSCDYAQMKSCKSAQINSCNNAQMKSCYSAQMKSCDYAQMEYCHYAQINSCDYAQINSCYELFILNCSGVSDYCYIISHNSDIKEKNKCTKKDFKKIFISQFLQEDGKYIAYKYLTKDMKSPIADNKIKYEIGKEYKEKCDKDIKNDCSYGINLATKLWCEKEKKEDDIIVEFEFNPKDTVVPNKTDGKFRVSKCKCIR